MCGFIFTIDVGTASRRLNIFGKTWVELIYAVWVSIPGQKLKHYEGGGGGLILLDGPLAQYSEQGKTRNPPTYPSHRRSPRENTPEWYFTYKWTKIFLKIFENYVWLIEDSPPAEKLQQRYFCWKLVAIFEQFCHWLCFRTSVTETDPEFWNKIYLGRFAGNRSRAGGERIFGTAPCLNSGVLTESHGTVNRVKHSTVNRVTRHGTVLKELHTASPCLNSVNTPRRPVAPPVSIFWNGIRNLEQKPKVLRQWNEQLNWHPLRF